MCRWPSCLPKRRERHLEIIRLVVAPVAFNQDVKALVPLGNLEPKFLTYYILAHSEELLKLVSSAGNSAGVLDTELVQNFKFLKPPYQEQRTIANALSDVDALHAQLDQLIAKKRDLKQATMQQLLTGQTRLPGFSGEWEMKRIDQICSLRTERVDPRIEGTQEFCIELEHIEPASGRLLGSSVASEQASMKTKFKVGDVLFGKLRAYQRKHWIASLPGVCSTEIWVLISNSEFSTPEFLYHLVSTDDFIEAASTAYGTHMPRSDWKVVRQVQVALPGLDEQTAIASVLSDMDTELAALEARRDKARSLKQGMMQELLTGRIRLV
jgi:type I restriction enzyme S subunit